MQKPKSVDAYMESKPQWIKGLKILRSILLDQQLEETIKWSLPVYCIDNKNIASIGSFKNDFALWFFQGASLTDPLQVLVNAQENKTKGMRSWRFTSYDQIDPKHIANYINEAVENQRSGNIYKAVRKPLQAPIVPPSLQAIFDKDPTLSHTYQELKISFQREFCEYIESAKREETKQRRLQKIIPLIISGISLNAKYRK